MRISCDILSLTWIIVLKESLNYIVSLVRSAELYVTNAVGQPRIFNMVLRSLLSLNQYELVPTMCLVIEVIIFLISLSLSLTF